MNILERLDFLNDSFRNRKVIRITLVLVSYLVSFIILDWSTRSFQILPGVVAWYPPDGVSFALLLGLGTWFTPSLGIASLISSFYVYQLSVAPLQLFGWAILISITFGTASTILRRRIQIDLQLRSLRAVLWLILFAVFISVPLAVVSVSGGPTYGALSPSGQVTAIFQWWVGEMIGILVVTPVLLIYIVPGLKRFVEGSLHFSWKSISLPRQPRNMPGLVITLLIILYLSFGLPDLRPFHPYYLIVIPLLWVALDYGIKGVVLGIPFLNFGITFLAAVLGVNPAEISELQLLILVISVVGLVVGAVRTEQIQAEEKVLQSEKRFRVLIENSADAITLLDTQGVAVYDSPAAPGMLGYTKEAWLGHNIFDLLHTDDLPATQALFRQLIQSSGSRINHTFRVLHKDGSWRWIEAVVTNLLNEPSINAIVANYRDITERKQAE
ncbi:MAG TPA: PAS domain S-box protein, partial [Anaerolineales bacterium]|nr:PAS domain S-box protein [Anaerolineales bacterium]